MIIPKLPTKTILEKFKIVVFELTTELEEMAMGYYISGINISF